MARVGLIFMQGARGTTPQEELVFWAKNWGVVQTSYRISKTQIAKTREVQAIHAAPQAALPTPYGAQHKLIIDIDPPDVPFHFGERLAGLIEKYQFDAVVYFGAGSLFEPEQEYLEQIVDYISKPEPSAISNNLYSSDWFAFNHVERALPLIRGEVRDNSVAWLLNNSGLYTVKVLPTGIDIDTPADVALVSTLPMSPLTWNQLSQFESTLRRIPLDRVKNILRTEGSHLMLIGRVPPDALTAINKAVRVWTRVVSEERGMVASGREARGEVRSVLVPWINARGVQGFFEDLAGMADAVLFDTRVLWAALGKSFTAADRFAADLFMADSISDSWLREFTEAAASVNIPIVMGGHSVVSAGVHILANAVKSK